MPRQRKSRSEQEVLRSAAQLAAQCQPRKKQRRITTSAARLEQLVERVEECIKTDDWGDESPALLVGLFCWAHREVYGVEVINELRRYYSVAYQGAKRLQADEFAGDFEDTLDFIRWVWARENEAEKWRRKNTGYGKRLHWRSVFVDRGKVTEWRLAQARQNGIA